MRASTQPARDLIKIWETDVGGGLRLPQRFLTTTTTHWIISRCIRGVHQSSSHCSRLCSSQTLTYHSSADYDPAVRFLGSSLFHILVGMTGFRFVFQWLVGGFITWVLYQATVVGAASCASSQWLFSYSFSDASRNNNFGERIFCQFLYNISIILFDNFLCVALPLTLTLVDYIDIFNELIYIWNTIFFLFSFL